MVQWILAMLLLLVPPAQQSAEPDVIALGRYQGIAEDLGIVLEQAAPLFAGSLARERTAAVMVARAFYESAFKRDVDEGRLRGDGGRAVCLMQLHRAPQGWSQDELALDRRKCFTAALELMRRSVRVCREISPELRLAAYTGGRCDRGQQESRRTFTLAEWLMAQRPPNRVTRGTD